MEAAGLNLTGQQSLIIMATTSREIALRRAESEPAVLAEAEAAELERSQRLGQEICGQPPAGPAVRPAAEPKPGTLTAAILATVRGADRPLTAREAWSILADDDDSVELRTVRSLFSYSSKRGWLQPAPLEGRDKTRRYYAVPEPVEADSCLRAPDSATVDEGIISVVEAAGQPLTLRQIADGFAELRGRWRNDKSFRTRVAALAGRGLLHHLDWGIYAGLDYDPQNYQPVQSDSDWIIELVEAAGRPRSEAEIIELSAEAGLSVAASKLEYLVRRGKIRQFGRQAYAAADFHGPPLPSERESTRVWIVRLVESSPQPLRVAQLRRQLEDDSIATDKLYADLVTLVRWGWLQRLKRGTYAAADYVGGVDDSTLSINQRIINLVDRRQQPLTSSEIFDSLASAGDESPTRSSLQTRLSSLRLEGSIQQLVSGGWVSLDYQVSAGQQIRPRPERPRPGSLAAAVVSVLEAAGRQLKTDEIFVRLQAVKPIPADHYQRTINKLPHFARAGWIRRPARGTYAAV